MPIYRGPDGKIIEERTRRIKDDELTDLRAKGDSQADVAVGKSADLTKVVGGKANVLPSDDSNDEDRTKMAGNRQSAAMAKSAVQEDDKTRLVGFDKSTGEGEAEAAIVGWLAIVGGPGIGNVIGFSYGSNSIGRGGASKVNVDYGDDQISRSGHAVITYDPKGRKFYLQHGSGNNLTYLDDAPVLIPTELRERAIIKLGNTSLLFIPLCGDKFDWQDLENGRADEQS